MTLSKALSQKRQFNSPALPSLNLLMSRTERIMARWPDVVANPPEKDRERLVAMVRDRLDRDEWKDTKLSLITSAGRALFDEERRERPDLAGLRGFYYRETRASTRAGFLGGMFSIYMDSFDAAADHTHKLASALSAVADRLGARWRMLLDATPEMLSPNVVADAVARKMISMDDLWTGLQKLGIHSPHGPGLMNAVHLAYVTQIEPHLDTRVEMKRLIEWLKPEGREAKSTGAGEAISALLGPWVNCAPPANDLRYLTENIIGIYGDPRVQRGGIWSAVPDHRLAVILRWLTGENIRFFLDVVSAVERSHMWEPRRKFWLGLHSRGRVDAAWVAFGDTAEQEAKQRGGGRGTLSFGRQTAGGSRSDTSLLVLKIGRKIVVEGSHSYKVHIFDETDRSAPALYQWRYDCEQIRLLPGSKARAHVGNWQSWVMEQI